MSRKRNLWRGLTTCTASLLTVAIAAGPLVDSYRTDIDKFLGLLSQHVLPDRFVRIRHYGILSPCNREALRKVQVQLDVPPVPKERKKKSYLEICQEKGWEIGVCKDCHCQRIIVRSICPAQRAPPFLIMRKGN